MLLFSVLCIFGTQLNLMGENKAGKAETLAEDKEMRQNQLFRMLDLQEKLWFSTCIPKEI